MQHRGPHDARLHGGVRIQLITAMLIRRGPENADFGHARVFPARSFSARSASYAIGAGWLVIPSTRFFALLVIHTFAWADSSHFDTPSFFSYLHSAGSFPRRIVISYNRPRTTSQRNCAAKRKAAPCQCSRTPRPNTRSSSH